MGYLKNISRLNGTDNVGGILLLQVARKADVVSIPDPIFGVITGDLVFAAGTGFTDWQVTYETAQQQTQSKVSREGVSKSNPLTFSVPRDNPVVRAQFLQAEDDEFIVLMLDSNGQRKLYGLLEAPVRFTFDHNSGRQLQDGNRYLCQFYYEGPENVNFYSGNITVAPPSTATSRVQFSTGELITTLSPTDVLIVSSDFAHTFTIVPGTGSGLPALVKWDTGELIASLQPGDTLVVDTDFSFDFEIIGSI